MRQICDCVCFCLVDRRWRGPFHKQLGVSFWSPSVILPRMSKTVALHDLNLWPNISQVMSTKTDLGPTSCFYSTGIQAHSSVRAVWVLMLFVPDCQLVQLNQTSFCWTRDFMGSSHSGIYYDKALDHCSQLRGYFITFSGACCRDIGLTCLVCRFLTPASLLFIGNSEVLEKPELSDLWPIT